jgi:hypothetical protein
MKRLTKFQQQEQQLAAEHKQQTEQSAATEFATVEKLLRHDALHTPVPPEVAHRLQDSVKKLPAKKPWWRRLVG